MARQWQRRGSAFPMLPEGDDPLADTWLESTWEIRASREFIGKPAW